MLLGHLLTVHVLWRAPLYTDCGWSQAGRDGRVIFLGRVAPIARNNL